MELSVLEAAGRLEELVRRVEAGESVVLTREGRPTVQLSTVKPKLTIEEKRRRLAEIEAAMALKVDAGGASAARSQDFLYDEFGLPK
jgi:prevent-host-death family protein